MRLENVRDVVLSCNWNPSFDLAERDAKYFVAGLRQKGKSVSPEREIDRDLWPSEAEVSYFGNERRITVSLPAEDLAQLADEIDAITETLATYRLEVDFRRLDSDNTNS